MSKSVEPKKPATGSVIEGKLVRLAGNKLVMTDKHGKESTHTLTPDAKLTCDGIVCKREDVKPGLKIRVNTQQNDRNVVMCVDSLNKQADFAACS